MFKQTSFLRQSQGDILRRQDVAPIAQPSAQTLTGPVANAWHTLLDALNSAGSSSIALPAGADAKPDRTHVANITDTLWHQATVAYWSAKVARVMNLNEGDTMVTACAALVHDIGKFSLDPAMVFVPGKLTDEQWVVMKTHPALGETKIRRLLFGGVGERIATIVGQHHENPDGSGYPNRLSGTQIDTGARIVHVVDAFDALTSNRCYRATPPMSKQEAFRHISVHQGTLFDPKVVSAFNIALFGIHAPLAAPARSSATIIGGSFSILQPT